MLLSLSLIILLSLLSSYILSKLKLPSLIGMILVGIILSKYIDPKIYSISSELKNIALVIILTRAGLTLKISDLKKVGRAAITLSFVPALFEILGVILLSKIFFELSFLESLLLGSVLAAVSPAIVVPRMINLIENGYGTKKSIPQLILAGSSLDDIFVITLFSVALSLVSNTKLTYSLFFKIPISILLGIVAGIIVANLLIILFKSLHMRDSVKILIILSVAFILLELEKYIMISSLISIMTIGITIKKKYETLAIRLSKKYNKLWIPAEIMLFVLIGANLDLTYALNNSLYISLFILSVLIFRMIGVYICVYNTKLNYKEKLFCQISYIPKATVQAAIGSVPLSMGLACGNIILTVAVISILITAPLGAILIDNLYTKLLKKSWPVLWSAKFLFKDIHNNSKN